MAGVGEKAGVGAAVTSGVGEGWGEGDSVGEGASVGVGEGEGVGVGVTVGVAAGVGVSVGVGVTVGVAVTVGLGVGGGIGTGGLGLLPGVVVETIACGMTTVIPPAVAIMVPSTFDTLVVPSGATLTGMILPRTLATTAGVSISYRDAGSASLVTRLTVSPMACFICIVVGPLSLAPSNLTISISPPGLISNVLPSKKVITTWSLLPALMISPGATVTPTMAGPQMADPAFLMVGVPSATVKMLEGADRARTSRDGVAAGAAAAAGGAPGARVPGRGAFGAAPSTEKTAGMESDTSEGGGGADAGWSVPPDEGNAVARDAAVAAGAGAPEDTGVAGVTVAATSAGPPEWHATSPETSSAQAHSADTRLAAIPRWSGFLPPPEPRCFINDSS